MNRQILVVANNQPGAYPTISAALARAEDGATIAVHAGRYEEKLVVGKRVNISAQDGAEHVDNRVVFMPGTSFKVLDIV